MKMMIDDGFQLFNLDLEVNNKSREFGICPYHTQKLTRSDLFVFL